MNNRNEKEQQIEHEYKKIKESINRIVYLTMQQHTYGDSIINTKEIQEDPENKISQELHVTDLMLKTIENNYKLEPFQKEIIGDRIREIIKEIDPKEQLTEYELKAIEESAERISDIVMQHTDKDIMKKKLVKDIVHAVMINFKLKPDNYHDLLGHILNDIITTNQHQSSLT